MKTSSRRAGKAASEPMENSGEFGSGRAPRRIPGATYRLQFNRHFTLAQAAAIVDYLRDLGITDCYASPLFQAGPESTHGYDICGYDEISPVLGGGKALDAFASRLKTLGLGLLLDMVPNHMGNDLSNRWWSDVLEKGPDSPYASFFDINWRPLKSDLRDKVLLPVLEDHYGKVLEAGKFNLVVWENGGLAVAYYDRHFPLSAESYRLILADVFKTDGNEGAWQAAGEARELGRLVTEGAGYDVKGRPKKTAAPGEPEISAANESWVDRVKQGIRKCLGASESFAGALRRALETYRKSDENPGWPDRLHGLLQRQHYRLAYWRVGSEEINYRRFFDVTELVSLRMELPEVFAATHQLAGSLMREGKITGLRIDHPDGLWDPKQYFNRLQELAGRRATEAGDGGLYVVAEKILTGDEPLPNDWPVDGTTGYDFLNEVNGLFVAAENRRVFDELYASLQGAGEPAPFRAQVAAAKRLVLEKSLISEWDSLTRRLKSVATKTRFGVDLTFGQLRAALGAVLTAFPVYRTYLTENSTEVPAPERERILNATREAREGHPSPDPEALAFIERLLLLRFPEDLDPAGRQPCREFVMRFQQLTGPLMAKGLEDTAFYRYNRLVSLNEVGGDPDRFGISVEEFHALNRRRAARWPHSLLATATHDTKRGEDVRARLNVLSEIPLDWARAVDRWRSLNTRHKSVVNGVEAPDANEEYLFYQTLVGAWVGEAESPQGLRTFRERIISFLMKALREAKTHTTWTEPNAPYEDAVRRFVEAVLSENGSNDFLSDFLPFQRWISFFGQFNSLAQVLLKLTCPGVPDFYQGAELWDFSLVDPDNRRPVDFEARRRMLAGLRARVPDSGDPPGDLPAELLKTSEDGRLKMHLIWRALDFRNRHRDLFARGSYEPLTVAGAKHRHVCAFAREQGRDAAIVLVPRLTLSLANGSERPPMGVEIWGDTAVTTRGAGGRELYRNVFTGEVIETAASGLPLAKALGAFPVALLERVPAG